MNDVHNEYQFLFGVYRVEYAVIANSIAENKTQLTFQPFDIGSKEGIIPQCRINIVFDSRIILFICPGSNLFLKSLRLSDPETIR